MRIRRLEVEWPSGKASVDFRNENGNPLPIVGIIGNNCSGKSLLQKMAIRLLRNAMHPDICFLDWDHVDGYGEFEYGGAIATGVVKQGKIVQRLAFPNTVLNGNQVSGALLGYTSDLGMRSFRIGESEKDSRTEDIVHAALCDLYKGDIRNSVIWVDSFDVGLDVFSARDFLKVLIKKSLEKDNQLIVSTVCGDNLSSLGDSAIRQLGTGTNMVERVLDKLGGFRK